MNGQIATTRPVRNIFFSWQSDLKEHKALIFERLTAAIEILNDRSDVAFNYLLDEATRDTPGAPNIVETILGKIDQCHIFVSDISIVNKKTQDRKMPNPNVMFELGYAVRSKSWERVILLFDITTGSIDDLPFDIQQNRISVFSTASDEPQTKKLRSIVKILESMNQGDHGKDRLDAMKEELKELVKTTPAGGQQTQTISVADHVCDLVEFLKLTEQASEYRPPDRELLVSKLHKVSKNIDVLYETAEWAERQDADRMRWRLIKDLEPCFLALDKARQRAANADAVTNFLRDSISYLQHSVPEGTRIDKSPIAGALLEKHEEAVKALPNLESWSDLSNEVHHYCKMQEYNCLLHEEFY